MYLPVELLKTNNIPGSIQGDNNLKIQISPIAQAEAARNNDIFGVTQGYISLLSEQLNYCIILSYDTMLLKCHFVEKKLCIRCLFGCYLTLTIYY